ncbi:MAG TPA: LpqN/LpqT family lipoprotein [Candidatus Corynebacterium avicola]|uniref:LpqN/LpqT family lipoprotein n=1 Tax=Candidatus Corynebacterium avicola TaxID=2838527 RepID=A0A9D1UMN5_9CORY|nr:LpqN/LpqT family lipoprotein [Candidatus Corynebacterium avicola]
MRHALRPLLIPTLCAVGLGLASCSEDSDDTSADDTTAASSAETGSGEEAEATDCAPYSGETVEANNNPGEPVVTVPVPEGWGRSTEMDSEMIRLMIGDGNVSEPPVPNVNVVMEQGDGEPEDLFAQSLDGVENSLETEDLTSEETSLCDFPAMRLDYVQTQGNIEWDTTQYMVSVPAEDGQYLATITLMAGDPASEEDLALRQEIIDGIEVAEAD